MKINRTHLRAESSELGPSPAVPTTGLSPAVAAVLEHLSTQTEPVSVGALAAMTGLHSNTVREHLETLIAAGFAAKEQALSEGRGRPAWLYFDTAGAAATNAPEYAGLASALAAHIHRTSDSPRSDGVAAGVDWGRRLAEDFAGEDPVAYDQAPAARDRVISLLDDLGFAPETDAAGSASSDEGSEEVVHVRLTRCPLLSAAHQYPDIVCGVHLGLVRGALDVFGDEASESQLEPFAEPGACRLHLQSPETNPHPRESGLHPPEPSPASGQQTRKSQL